MRYSVTKEFTFSAAHVLPNHDGKCSNRHGHNYTVAVQVGGETKRLGSDASDEGMVIDFGELSRIWKEHLDPVLDHSDLNESLPDTRRLAPTAEWVASYIFDVFEFELAVLDPRIGLEEVTVWETDTAYATVRR